MDKIDSTEPLATRPPSRKHSEDTKKEIAKRLYALAKATNEPCDAERIDLYLQALADLDPEPLLMALEGMLLNCRWFPKIPEIRETVLGKLADQKTLEETQAELAWERAVNYAMNWHGDIGALPGAPKLSTIEQRALSIIGGPLEIQETVGTPQFGFVHRDFLLAFPRLASSEQDIRLLEDRVHRLVDRVTDKLRGVENEKPTGSDS